MVTQKQQFYEIDVFTSTRIIFHIFPLQTLTLMNSPQRLTQFHGQDA